MSAEIITKALLEADSGVVALVGAQIWLDARPEGEPLPALVMHIISEADVPPIDATPGLIPVEARVQIDCHAATAAGRQALVAAVLAAGDRKSGTVAGAAVEYVFVERGPSRYDALVEVFEQPVDYLMRYLR